MRIADARRATTAALLFAGGLAAVTIAAPAARAAADTACRDALTGTFLISIVNAKGVYASSSLVTLHGDGTVSIVDSRQHRGVQGSSFSAQMGSYRCTGAAAATARTLDFSFPKRAGIARLDWIFERAKGDGPIAGTVVLYIYSGVKGVDPFGKGGKLAGTFRFRGTAVTPPGR